LILRRERKMADKKVAMAKKAPARKTTTKKAVAQVAKGDSYVCEVCGLAVTVDEACGCVDVCDIICCGQPMKPKKVKARAAKK
jgi:rubrerythrin